MSNNERLKIFLNHRGTNFTLWAKFNDLSVSSVRNTFSGIKPIKKVVSKIHSTDKELFDQLPTIAQELIK